MIFDDLVWPGWTMNPLSRTNEIKSRDLLSFPLSTQLTRPVSEHPRPLTSSVIAICRNSTIAYIVVYTTRNVRVSSAWELGQHYNRHGRRNSCIRKDYRQTDPSSSLHPHNSYRTPTSPLISLIFLLLPWWTSLGVFRPNQRECENGDEV